MYVSRLRIGGIRGFHDSRMVDLTFTRPDGTHPGWTVLAGRNGSGKTTMLRALGAVLTGPGEPIAFDGWLTGGADRGSVAAFVHRSPEPSLPVMPCDLWEDETVSADERAVYLTISGLEDEHGRRDQIEEWAYSEEHRHDHWWGASRRWGGFCAGYGPFRRLSGGSHESETYAQRARRSSPLTTLFYEEAALSEAVSWLVDLHLRRLEGRPGASELLEAVLDLMGDGLLPDGYRISRVDSDGLWVSRGDKEFVLQEMSDGYRAIAALVLDLVRHLHSAYGEIPLGRSEDGCREVRLPGVVLIDEVDAHLHVSWQKRIGDWLKSRFPLIQFIVTTHSPYVCQSADPGGLIWLGGPDDTEPPHVVDEDLYQRVVYGSGDDAVLSELFGLDSPYSQKAEVLRRRLGDLEGRVLAGEATAGEAAEFEELSRTLTSSTMARVDEVAARLSRKRG
ncbi:ATP-binding protein [Streptomyces sp. MZ04]|uniref:AAA family ATPase n=1 Tax=Streptomyces sp. MZ04 TaxID=2559236 RepID=UPI00107EAACB|nr:ATP-binding protein [Streptomyces sp. MZ04]TGB08325.1 AAA family ATPase [Streptomyces sp. MZ04]